MNRRNPKLILDQSRPRIKTTAPATVHSQGGGDKYAPEKIKLTRTKLITGTWNVRSLSDHGKEEVLINEMNRLEWNILGICEMRWKGTGEVTSEDGHKILYSGDKDKKIRGVGFIIHKNTIKSVIEINPVSGRLITIRLSSKPQNVTIIQVYAPTSESSEEEIEEFYYSVQSAINRTPKKDIIIVQGDWNAKVGNDAHKEWYDTVGKFSIGNMNERGLRLLEFAKQNQLVIANTLFNHKESRRTTWHSPDGMTHNQIDYIMISKRFRTSIIKNRTRSFLSPDIGSDHDLVMMTMKIKLMKQMKKGNGRIRYNVHNLRETHTREKYQLMLKNKFAPLIVSEEEDVEKLASEFTKVMNETAEEVLGKQRQIKKPWITNEILEQCDKRRKLKGDRFKNETKLDEYRKANRNTRKAIRSAKNQWVEEQVNELEKNMEKNNSRKAYDIIKKLTKERQSRINVIENKAGEILTNPDDVRNRWKEYCEELYNHKAITDKTLIGNMNEENGNEELPILRAEVEEAIRSLKRNKAPGIDNIQAELIKEGGSDMVEILLKICNLSLKTGLWPSQWTQSILIPLPKKGDIRKCNNYRTISLISHTSKILLRVIKNRITPRIEAVLSENQAGFRKGRSTTEQITNLRNLCEKSRNHNHLLFHNFIDFKKAFDRVWHEALWDTMIRYNIGKEVTFLIKSLYETAKNTVMVNNDYSSWFKSNVGVRQGCILSPVLFNLFLERIMNDTLEKFDGGAKCGGRIINNLRFADDIDLITESEEKLKELTTLMDSIAKKYGMEISPEKSKIMVTGECDQKFQTTITVNGKELEQVKQFRYLGALITEDSKSNREIKARIGAATNALVKLDKVIKDRTLKTKTKMRIIRSIVTSTVLYGCESWTLNAKAKKDLEVFDLKCHRRVLGITWKDRRTNVSVKEEIERKIGKIEDLYNIVKSRKLKYFGHMIRTKNSLAKDMITGLVEGDKRRGRPQRVWINDIEEWSGKNMAEVIRLAENRREWRIKVHEWVHQRPRKKVKE